MKLLELAVIGLTNCGKSTFVDNLLNRNNVCIISSKPHTTQKLTLGSFLYNKNNNDSEGIHVILYDTPGLNSSKKKHIQNISKIAENSFKNKDVCIIMFDACKNIPAFLIDFAKLIKTHGIPVIALINKQDKISKGKLLPIIDQLQDVFEHVIPISALKEKLDIVMDVLCEYATRDNHQNIFNTNISNEERIINRTQEVLLELFNDEIPYNCIVNIDDIIINNHDVSIYESIHVKSSHYPILISKIKTIGTLAREKIINMLKHHHITEIRMQQIPQSIRKINLFIEIKKNKS